MDRRNDMSLPGSYYMQRGLSGPISQSGLSGFNGSLGMQFQSNIGISSIGLLPIEQSLPISPHNNVSMTMPSSESVKRKRGRPRKYGADHGGVSLALSPLSSAPPAMITSSPKKRGRGRPLGSGKKKHLPSLGDLLSGSAGTSFTPHVIAIAAGDDITTKIMSFSQQGSRAICILSANGSVSTATLHQPSTSGGTVTYEGRFEILCLSGSYLLTDNAVSRNRSGGLNVTLATPDGRVIGGGVGGLLIAASPIQVIVGSFIWGNSMTKNKIKQSTNGGADSSDVQTFENPITATNVLNPGSLMDVWPVDMRNSHVDIDLMRR